MYHAKIRSSSALDTGDGARLGIRCQCVSMREDQVWGVLHVPLWGQNLGIREFLCFARSQRVEQQQLQRDPDKRPRGLLHPREDLVCYNWRPWGVGKHVIQTSPDRVVTKIWPDEIQLSGGPQCTGTQCPTSPPAPPPSTPRPHSSLELNRLYTLLLPQRKRRGGRDSER